MVMLMKKTNSTEEILNLIKSSDNIGVISHKNPDGDNIGSTISVILGVRENLNKNIFGIKVDNFPQNLLFLDNPVAASGQRRLSETCRRDAKIRRSGDFRQHRLRSG